MAQGLQLCLFVADLSLSQVCAHSICTLHLLIPNAAKRHPGTLRDCAAQGILGWRARLVVAVDHDHDADGAHGQALCRVHGGLKRRARTLSSPWTMTMTPMVRVDRPQLFCHACALPPASVSNSIPNMREKFWPRQWLVPPCVRRGY